MSAWIDQINQKMHYRFLLAAVSPTMTKVQVRIMRDNDKYTLDDIAKVIQQHKELVIKVRDYETEFFGEPITEIEEHY